MKLKTKSKASETEELIDHSEDLPLGNFVPHPDIPYRKIDKSWVTTLVDSILKGGLDVPLVLWDGGEEDLEMEVGKKKLPARFIVAGMHRRKALEVIKRDHAKRFEELFPEGKIPTRVRTGTLADAIAMQLRENLQRKNATAEDVIPQLQMLSDECKLKQKEIAKMLGMSEGWVSQMLDLEETLGKNALKEVVTGGVMLADVRKAAKEVKSGKSTPAVALKAAKGKTATKKKKGKTRADKRESLKTLASRYRALPALKNTVKVAILEGMLAYALGESDELPEEIEADEE